jgi:hypothetical protein
MSSILSDFSTTYPVRYFSTAVIRVLTVPSTASTAVPRPA